jgi:hypothetical protein
LKIPDHNHLTIAQLAQEIERKVQEQEMDSVKFDNDDLYDSCASCGKHQNAASNLAEQIFKVNTTNGCGHKFCEICLNRELSRKRQFLCPKCHNIVSSDKVSNMISSFLLLSYP